MPNVLKPSYLPNTDDSVSNDNEQNNERFNGFNKFTFKIANLFLKTPKCSKNVLPAKHRRQR